MGQHITVRARPGASPRVRLFDCNRSLTGMAIERYESGGSGGAGESGESGASEDPALRPLSPRPPDVLAERLITLGATSVTVASSVVTVEAPADRWRELEPRVIETIEHLFGFYGDDAGWSPEARSETGTTPGQRAPM